jgi:FkbM family methyltransferase
VADRVEVINAFAAAPGTLTGVCHYGYRHDPDTVDAYVAAHRFIGGTWGEFGEGGEPEFAPVIEAVNLDGLLSRFGIEELALLKIDCEGCEYQFLDTPAVAYVDRILGEFHRRPEGIMALLAATHDVTIRLHPEVALKVTLNVARSPDEAERQAKGENVIAAGQAADRAADIEAAQEIAAAAQAGGFDRGPIDG